MAQAIRHSIEVSDLSIGYKLKNANSTVANSINFSASKGELIAIVGPNGIGKSTLLRTLMNMQPALSGAVKINDKATHQLKQQELATAMSVVLTEPIASKNLTVFELIALGRQPYTNWIGKLSNEDSAVIEAVIAQTDVSALKNKKCFELSDGQLQRVMIGRALAQDTDLMMLDEPTTHLDMYHKAYILNLLKEIAVNSNKCVLFSSHEIELAIQLCNKMLVMTDDEVYFDTPDQLVKDGVFEKLFPEKLIKFDAAKRGFTIVKK